MLTIREHQRRIRSSTFDPIDRQHWQFGQVLPFLHQYVFGVGISDRAVRSKAGRETERKVSDYCEQQGIDPVQWLLLIMASHRQTIEAGKAQHQTPPLKHLRPGKVAVERYKNFVEAAWRFRRADVMESVEPLCAFGELFSEFASEERRVGADYVTAVLDGEEKGDDLWHRCVYMERPEERYEAAYAVRRTETINKRWRALRDGFGLTLCQHAMELGTATAMFTVAGGFRWEFLDQAKLAKIRWDSLASWLRDEAGVTISNHNKGDYYPASTV